MDTPKKPEKNPPPSQEPRETPGKQEPENEPRRYDEADPNWREPDVQMRNPQSNPNINTPH